MMMNEEQDKHLSSSDAIVIAAMIFHDLIKISIDYHSPWLFLRSFDDTE